MAFQSLYRKHRPQTFGELVGQEAVSTALRNAVREGRVGHAYLFSGPRGTGKTTTARLLAKALNCTGDRSGLEPGEPCNACDSCTEITAGTSMDVVELDAASNRGVGEMRALLERVAYRSAGGARKVYIVDEVHMLTKEASTALLKTLEEPPDHVIFVLATTDPQMVLATIRSRTQHFEFSLLPADRLAAHLAEIAGREGVEADPEALATIARRAGGSARDALSLLDQALAYGEGQLRPEQVAALFGGTATSARGAIVEALGRGDVPGLLERLDALLGAGVDARTLADDLLRHLREVFLVLSSPGRVRLETPEEERAALTAQGEALGLAAVVRALESLGEAAIEIRRAPDPRLVLEVALVRLARRDVTSLDALADRVARLERALDDLRGALASGAVPAAPPGRRPDLSGASGTAGGVAVPGTAAGQGSAGNVGAAGAAAGQGSAGNVGGPGAAAGQGSAGGAGVSGTAVGRPDQPGAASAASGGRPGPRAALGALRKRGPAASASGAPGAGSTPPTSAPASGASGRSASPTGSAGSPGSAGAAGPAAGAADAAGGAGAGSAAGVADGGAGAGSGAGVADAAGAAGSGGPAAGVADAADSGGPLAGVASAGSAGGSGGVPAGDDPASGASGPAGSAGPAADSGRDPASGSSGASGSRGSVSGVPAGSGASGSGSAGQTSGAAGQGSGAGGAGAPADGPGAGSDGGSISLEEAVAAWSKAVDGMRPRLKAMAREAHPVRVEGDTIVVGLPSRFEKVHLPTITGESATVTAALSEILGRKVRFTVVLDDNVVAPAGDGPPPGPAAPSDPGVGAEAMVAEMARPTEPGGGGRGVDSPVALVIETFGASIESETVRE